MECFFKEAKENVGEGTLKHSYRDHHEPTSIRYPKLKQTNLQPTLK